MIECLKCGSESNVGFIRSHNIKTKRVSTPFITTVKHYTKGSVRVPVCRQCFSDIKAWVKWANRYIKFKRNHVLVKPKGKGPWIRYAQWVSTISRGLLKVTNGKKISDYKNLQAEGLYNKGVKAKNNKKYLQALSYFDKALKVYREKSTMAYVKISDVYTDKAETLLYLKKFGKAFESINLALKYAPYNNKAKGIKEIIEREL
ncbi:MAG: tetratricopeptide repeat protein [Candidatus Lokiarchaeota archaeon]|nr:tetratricopeptide repeat protein [Candidatus Lokiarchaeota archaeon]